MGRPCSSTLDGREREDGFTFASACDDDVRERDKDSGGVSCAMGDASKLIPIGDGDGAASSMGATRPRDFERNDSFAGFESSRVAGRAAAWKQAYSDIKTCKYAMFLPLPLLESAPLCKQTRAKQLRQHERSSKPKNLKQEKHMQPKLLRVHELSMFALTLDESKGGSGVFEDILSLCIAQALLA